MTRLELISEIGKGRIAFRAENFEGQDLSGLDLTGCDLRRSNFRNANLSDTILTDCILVLADLEGANLSGAVLDNVDWELVKNADLATFKGAIYEGKALKENVTVDTLGKYQRLVSDRFIQIGCLKGNETYWKTMDDIKLFAEVDKVNPAEKADAKAWKDSHLSKTISDHEDLKNKELK